MKDMNLFYTPCREEWRSWLAENFRRETEVWFVFPMKESGEERLSYNDAVEEALCFGWIDSTIRNLGDGRRAQRFTPRKPGSPYSRPNIERLCLMERENRIHPEVLPQVQTMLHTPYEYPTDILAALQGDEAAWAFYSAQPGGYRRIRVAYIDAARKRPEEFARRLESFLAKCRAGKRIAGYGGIDKYYEAE